MFGFLRVTAGPDQGRFFTLTEGQTLVLGRGKSMESHLHDPHVGRVHCQVQFTGGKVVLADLSGASGTLVNGQRVSECELVAGDVIRIGDTALSFQWSQGDEQTTQGV
jgi:pSer/pThr/pTyr-binding forkhead associated (FHA) protein